MKNEIVEGDTVYIYGVGKNLQSLPRKFCNLYLEEIGAYNLFQ